MERESRRQSLAGGGYALLAFGAWGVNPIYFKAVAEVAALEVLASRVIWSLPLLILLVVIARRWPVIRQALGEGRTILALLCSTTILMVNWFIYIHAMNTDQVLESSLGYFINPLVNVIFGLVIFKERLRPWQVLAVGLAALGVLNLVFRADTVPWIALSLACTFSTYGLIRKLVKLGSVEGLLVETALVMPVALGYVVYLALMGEVHFLSHGWRLDLLIILAGPVSALPLIWFTSGARRLDYSTVGIFQYIAPSLQFLLGVFVYEEPFGNVQLVTFACIWTALAIFTVDSLRHMRRVDGKLGV
ncbi:MAG: EamA family transporter RarD [Proteobacteria bacterium]|nr:EamA family transporter RarD [Pseudomonadota bacterium]